MRPLVALTLGDPAGIGPEICLRAAADEALVREIELVLVGSSRALERARAATGLDLELGAFRGTEGSGDCRPSLIDIGGEPPAWGAPSPEGGRQAGEALERAVELVQSLRRRRPAALVTAPLAKEALRAAGYPWMGHTPFLASLDGVDPEAVFMLFLAPELAVVLATGHIPLREVADSLTLNKIVASAQRAADLLAGRATRIAVAGLNPHAGEGGLLGGEEQAVLGPAVELLRKDGYRATGPHPPDTVYRAAREGRHDLVVAPYHDQGLVAVKTVGLGASVHVTAGLSFVRTSVDHGTAYDIAGTGRADVEPLRAAVREGARLARRFEES